MNTIYFDNTTNPEYHWCGKFVAPGEEWTHLTRALMDYEFMLVTEGVLYISDGTNDYEVHAGEYLLMSPTPFQHGVKSSYCEFTWLHFRAEQIPESTISAGTSGTKSTDATDSSETSALPIQPISPDSVWTFPIHGHLAFPDRLIVLLKQLQDSDRRYRNAALNACLCGAILGELHLQNPLCETASTKLSKEQFYNDILDYVEWHISENVRVSQIADYFGYNEKYLTTFFGNIAGISLKQYILQRKMEHAKATLSETNQPVSQVGYALGFSDAHNFSNAFKKVVGTSPAEYRKSFSKRNVFRV